MKNVTLSIPDELLLKSREYAQKHGTSLNKMIRKLLSSMVTKDVDKDLQQLFEHMDNAKLTKNKSWSREEIHER